MYAHVAAYDRILLKLLKLINFFSGVEKRVKYIPVHGCQGKSALLRVKGIGANLNCKTGNAMQKLVAYMFRFTSKHILLLIINC